jgi:hypothetical protein
MGGLMDPNEIPEKSRIEKTTEKEETTGENLSFMIGLGTNFTDSLPRLLKDK